MAEKEKNIFRPNRTMELMNAVLDGESVVPYLTESYGLTDFEGNPEQALESLSSEGDTVVLTGTKLETEQVFDVLVTRHDAGDKPGYKVSLPSLKSPILSADELKANLSPSHGDGFVKRKSMEGFALKSPADVVKAIAEIEEVGSFESDPLKDIEAMTAEKNRVVIKGASFKRRKFYQWEVLRHPSKKKDGDPTYTFSATRTLTST